MVTTAAECGAVPQQQQAQPAMSGGSCTDFVELAAVVSSSPLAAAAGEEAVAAVAPTAESDNESVDNSCADDVPAPKFRKLVASEPPPSVRVSAAAPLATAARRKRCMLLTHVSHLPPTHLSAAAPQSTLRPELLSVLEAHATTFLPPPAARGAAAVAAGVTAHVRKIIGESRTEDNFYW